MTCCTSVPETVDREIDDKGAYVENVRKGIKQFEKNIAKLITLYQEMMISFEQVGYNFVDFSQGGDPNFQSFTKNFLGGMRELRNGKAMLSLQGDIKRYVKEKIPPISAHCEKTFNVYKSLVKLQKKYDTNRHKMSVTEKKYAKMNKSLNESKGYVDSIKKCKKVSSKYDEVKKEFHTAVDQLRELLRGFVGISLPGYAACTSAFSKFLGQELEKYAGNVLPPPADGKLATDDTDWDLTLGKEDPPNRQNSVSPSPNPLTLEEQYRQQTLGA